MKKLSLILLIALFTVILSLSASAKTYDLSTTKKQPTIVVPFGEETVMDRDSVTFTDSAGAAIDMSSKFDHTDGSYWYYNFIPDSVLGVGNYKLTIAPKDSLGNIGENVIINLTIEHVRIWITNPRLEVSSTEVFNVEIQTSEAADCMYSTLFQPINYSDLDESFVNNGISHTIPDFTAPNYSAYKPLWVICRDTYGYDTPVKEFNLSVDTTPPNILEARAYPEIVTEYDALGQKTTKLTVKTDDPTVCKYSDDVSELPYYKVFPEDLLKAGFFYQNDEASKLSYKTENEKVLRGMDNGKEYIYFITCLNLAQIDSGAPTTIRFSVNLAAEFAITSTSPADGGYIGSRNYILNVSTNKAADCYYNLTGDATIRSIKMTSRGKTGDYYWFSSASITGAEGKNNVSIYCMPAANPQKRDIQFTLDTTPPIGILVNVTSPQWVTDYLAAEFFFEDNQSGVDYYNYTVKEGSNIIVDYTVTEDSEVTIEEDREGKDLNLTNGKRYDFSVIAVNKAGIKSSVKTGSITIDKSKIPKDTFKPVVQIIKVSTTKGTNITLICTDTLQPSSGCNLSRRFYGTSTTSSCSASNIYNRSFLITKSQYICYNFYDNAGNPAANTTFVNVSGFIDSDGDGEPDESDQCPGTPLGKEVDYKGCSCSDLDDDGDGADNCKDVCPNTPMSENASSNGCSASQTDYDKDGMPDWWEIKYGLDPYNSNDANDDNDGDGLTNLEEYKMGTDPNNHDSDGDGFWDGGERTSGTNATDKNSYPPDNDGDFIDDNWEISHGLDPNDPTDAYEDPDGDGLNNFMEYNYNTNPQNPDSDGDGIKDGGEVTSGTDPNDPNDTPPDKDKDGMDDDWEKRYTCMDAAANDAEENYDTDTLNNLNEYLWGANPCEGDTDGDGMPDDWEIKYGLNPRENDADKDYDNDKFTNLEEYVNGTNPRDKNDWPRTLDTDKDGIPDWWEKQKGLNSNDPTDADQDPDGDGLTSLEEYSLKECLDPLNPDTDGDGFDDGKEISSGTDPCDPTDAPKSYWWILILILILAALGVGGYFGYKYLYPMIEKKFGKPTLRRWPPFERVVGVPRRMVPGGQAAAKKPELKKEIKEEKPKPKTTAEKLAAIASAPFDRLTELGKPKEKAGKEKGAEKEEPGKEAGKEAEGKTEKGEAKEKTTKEKLEEIGRTSIDKLAAISATPKTTGKKPIQKKMSESFKMLDRIGKAMSREEIFNALPSKKEDVFAELKKAIQYTEPRLERIERITKDKDIGELVKTFEKMKLEKGIRMSVDVFKTLLGHLLKAKKINIKDIEEVLLKLKDQKVFSDRQVSDVLFSLKE
jgi:hypothetical protein